MEAVIKKVNREKKKLFLTLSLKWSMDNRMKDSKQTPIYQFPLFVTGIWNVSTFKPPLIP